MSLEDELSSLLFCEVPELKLPPTLPERGLPSQSPPPPPYPLFGEPGRTTPQDEADLILNCENAIEAQAAERITLDDLKGLLRTKEGKKLKNYFLVYSGKHRMKFE